MQRICRQLFAAVVGVVALAGAASAQHPAPQAAPAPAKAAAGVVPAAGVIHMRGTGGCASCGTPAVNHYAPYGQYGAINNNGAGSARASAAFIFGSSSSFFDPCGNGVCGTGHGRGRAGCGDCGCPTWPLAQPFGTKYNGCQYDTFLNH